MKAFDINKTVSYWLEGAKYDLSVANAMLNSKKYPYALFMGHLPLEKLLKAFVVKHIKSHAPFSHSLPYSKLDTLMRTKRSTRNARKPIPLKS